MSKSYSKSCQDYFFTADIPYMTDLDSLIIRLISFCLLKCVSFQEVCHLSKMYLFMNGLKLLKGILKTVCSKFKDSFAFLSTRSLLRMPI